MIYFHPIISFVLDWLTYLANIIRIKALSRAALEFENLAMRNQLAIYQQKELNHKIPKPQTLPHFANCGC